MLFILGGWRGKDLLFILEENTMGIYESVLHMTYAGNLWRAVWYESQFLCSRVHELSSFIVREFMKRKNLHLFNTSNIFTCQGLQTSGEPASFGKTYLGWLKEFSRTNSQNNKVAPCKDLHDEIRDFKWPLTKMSVYCASFT